MRVPPLGLIRAATAAALLSALAPVAPARDAPARDASVDAKRPTFRADTALVVLDLVVRDKKGQPIRDLRPDEVQIYEDGVRRDVAGLSAGRDGHRRRGPRGGRDPRAGAAAPRQNPTRLLSLTTLIFEPLDGASAAVARKAALQFLDRALGERSRVAVVRLGQGLSLVQPFTSNAEHLRRAVELVTNTAPDAQQSVLAQAQRAAEYYRKLKPRPRSLSGVYRPLP